MNDISSLFPFLPHNPNILWYAFLGIVLIFFFYSIFLLYHWFRYGMNIIVSLIATVIYGGVSGIILITMLTSFATLIS
ncbi:hypothetical protein HYW58_01830 [Candidatus Kaiserbacteria bacterium]|nr:hypothetical protein [Candidatus Kaiserbacteria bacterium]